MNELVKLATDTTNNLFGDNHIDFLFYLSLLISGILLFREYKLRIVEDKNKKNEQIDSAIKATYDLKIQLELFAKFERETEEYTQLREKVIVALPFLSYKLTKEINELTQTVSNDKLQELINGLEYELNILKYNQDSVVVALYNKALIDHIDFIYKSKIHPILIPFILTFLTLFAFLLILFFSFSFSNIDTIFSKYYLIQLIVNTILFVFYSLLIDSLIQNDKIKKGWKTWAFIIGSFIISLTIFLMYKLHITITIVHFIIFFIMFWLLKKYFVS